MFSGDSSQGSYILLVFLLSLSVLILFSYFRFGFFVGYLVSLFSYFLPFSTLCWSFSPLFWLFVFFASLLSSILYALMVIFYSFLFLGFLCFLTFRHSLHFVGHSPLLVGCLFFLSSYFPSFSTLSKSRELHHLR